MLTVQDDGIGVPAQFDPERADLLGLQLVQDLTDQLHGEISLSRDGGSRFNVSFDVNGLAGAAR